MPWVGAWSITISVPLIRSRRERPKGKTDSPPWSWRLCRVNRSRTGEVRGARNESASIAANLAQGFGRFPGFAMVGGHVPALGTRFADAPGRAEADGVFLCAQRRQYGGVDTEIRRKVRPAAGRSGTAEECSGLRADPERPDLRQGAATR